MNDDEAFGWLFGCFTRIENVQVLWRVFLKIDEVIGEMNINEKDCSNKADCYPAFKVVDFLEGRRLSRRLAFL